MVAKNLPANTGTRVRSWFGRMPHTVEELILCTSTLSLRSWPWELRLGPMHHQPALCNGQLPARRKQGKPVKQHEDPAQPNLNNFKRIHLLKQKKLSSTPWCQSISLRPHHLRPLEGCQSMIWGLILLKTHCGHVKPLWKWVAEQNTCFTLLW